MPLGIAIMIMIVIALAGAISVTMVNNQKKELLAQAGQAMQNQESHVKAVYDQIESNLASIREHENMITMDLTGPEQNDNMLPEERIQNEIDFIKKMIDENNNLIASLNDQIDTKDKRIASYEHSVKDLQARVGKYQEQLDQLVAEKDALKTDLDNTIAVKNTLSTKVDELGSQVNQQSSVIYDQQVQLIHKDNVMNTAYYKVGSYKSLKDQNIIQKEGGFLGINKVLTMAGVPDTSIFQVIDTRDVKKIPVFAKRWEIVTGQDPSTYSFQVGEDGKVDWITITNPEKFWAKSKYLVIAVRDDEYDEVALYR
jgi:peptidoglycan hydrolase CwlO-like protein